MAIKTLLEFATDTILIRLLVKERAKQRGRNKSDKKHQFKPETDFDTLSTRKKLCRIMPPRRTWVRPTRRIKNPVGALDKRKNASKALLYTINRDLQLQQQGHTFAYLDELHAFLHRIRSLIASDDLSFQSPTLLPILKDQEQQADGTTLVTCRPLSVYSRLEDKIILALTSQYLTLYLDRYLHDNILSYRPLRKIGNESEKRLVDFNDGARLINEYRLSHAAHPIYAADCDIKKFYDIIPHQVVRDCFSRLLQRSQLTPEGQSQVMRVLNAYLASYNYYESAWLQAQRDSHVYWKVRRRLHDTTRKNTYQLGWPAELGAPGTDIEPRGVPQGGSLSLLVANIVLNDVDQAVLAGDDPDRLFIRFCDDMLLLHTDYDECCRLMKAYADSLTAHGLYYHPFKNVSECSRHDFWHIKSHHPFLWGEGDGNCNRYIGFLGYEISRNGLMRLRKSNIKRIDEKFTKLRFILHRYRKQYDEDKYHSMRDRKLNNIEKGLNIYTSLDQLRFRHGRQYRHIQRLLKRFKKY